MKKFIKIIGGLIVLLLLALILIPVFFKGQIKDYVINTANEELNATVALEEVSLSLISSFPNLEVELKGFEVVGKDDFEGISLVELKELEIELGLSALWQKQDLNLKKIKVKGLDLNVMVNEAGLANYDIVQLESSEAVSQEATKSNETSTSGEGETQYTLSLNEYKFEDVNLVYNDASSKLYLEIVDLDHEGKGDFSSSQFDLETETEIEGITFIEAGVTLLKQVSLDADFNAAVNVENSRIDLKENSITLNAMHLSYDGFVQLNADESIEMDLMANTNEISMKEIFSLVPNAYIEGYEAVKAKGSVELKANVKGLYSEEKETYPAFDVALKVNDGEIRYPDLPDAISEIQVDVQVAQSGTQLAQTTVDINRFAFNSAGGNFNLTAHLRDLLTDPNILLDANMNLALAELHRSFPMDETKDLEGTISGMIHFKGKASDTANIEDIDVNGNLIALDIPYQYETYPKFYIGGIYMEFSPNKIAITNVDLTAGESKITGSGSIANFLAYGLGDGTLQGDLSVYANKIMAEEWLVEDEPTVEEVKDGSSMDSDSSATAPGSDTAEVLMPIPTDINFQFQAACDELTYGDFKFENLAGKVGVNNGVIGFDGITMDAFEGNINANGSFATDEDANGEYSFNLNVTSLDFQSMAVQSEMVRDLAPVLKSSKGNLSGRIDLKGELDKYLNNDLNTVDSKGQITTSTVHLTSSALKKLDSRFSSKMFNGVELQPTKLSYTIKDGVLTFNPFELKGAGITSEFSGSSSLEGQCDLVLASAIPYKVVKASVNNSFMEQIEKLGGTINENTIINANIRIVGDVNDPEFKMDFGLKNVDLKDQIEDLVKDAVEDVIDNSKEDLIKEAEKALVQAKEAAEKLNQEAEKAAQQIIAEGNKQADRIVAEAKKQGDDLVKKAKSPLEKVGAKTAAKELNKEAAKQAENLKKEAKKNADKLRNQSKTQGDKIIKTAEAELNKLKNS